MHIKKKRLSRAKVYNAELVNIFWSAPLEAFFDQITIASVTNKSEKTLEADRWRKQSIPFRKCSGRVLYKKSDVIKWFESHELICGTNLKNKKKYVK